MKNAKKIKYSINSSVIVICAVIVAVLLNSILIAFDDKMSLEIDLTKDEIYRLSEETKDVIKGIDKQTNIAILYDGRELNDADPFLSVMTSIIEKYTEVNDKISCEPVDYYNDATYLIDNYPQEAIKEISYRGLSPLYAMIIVQGDKFDIADANTYFVESYEKDLGEIVAKSAIENVLTNKLATLSSEKETFENIYYTNGHGEKINVTIGNLLKGYGYSAKIIDLSKNEIGDVKKSVVIIDSPAADFTAEEIEKLDSFLEAGGNVQVYFNPLLSNDELPRLESYLASEWGIVRGHGVVYDNEKVVGDGGDAESFGAIASGVLSGHDIVKSISSSGMRVMYSSANPLEISADKESAINVEEVVTTSDKAVLKTVETAQEPANASDTSSKYNIVLTSTKDKYDDVGNKTTGKILVCGSSYAMDTLPLQSDCANEDLLINSINWMNGSNGTINIDAKDFPQGGLVIENTPRWIWFGTLVVVVPILILGLGIVVFVKRRYK